jgi:pimeloyl-ACP methyl ester carboxylesterase
MSVTVTDKFIDAGGITFQYREAGLSEEAAGDKTIVFLHGAGGQSPKSARFPALLGEKHRVLIPSRPGFDHTPVGGCKTIKDVVEAVAKFIAAAAPGQKIHLVAQSAGGAIGAWLAILHPELIASLVLSAPAAFAVRHAPPPSNSGGDSVPPNLADMAKRLYGDNPAWDSPPTPEEREQTGKNAQANMGRFTAPEGNSDLKGRLAEIKVPVLLLVASADQMIPEDAMRPYQELIPSCTRIVVYGAAHELPISAAPIWVKLVADFVDRGEYFVVNMG